MNRAGIILFILLIFISMTTIAYSQPSEESLRTRLTELYVRVYRLGREGINVTKVVSELNLAVKYIDSGRYSDADKILDNVEAEVTHLEDVSGSIIFWSNFHKYSTVAVLLSIPVLTYFILPRIYMMIWYRLRRRWIARR